MPGQITTEHCSQLDSLQTLAPEERPEVTVHFLFEDPLPLCPRASALPGPFRDGMPALPCAPRYISPRHNSVSAESFVPGQQSLPSASFPKTEEQAHRLVRAVKEVFLFSASDKEQDTILDAFVEKVISSKGTDLWLANYKAPGLASSNTVYDTLLTCTTRSSAKAA